jgi:hypothetical protein
MLNGKRGTCDEDRRQIRQEKAPPIIATLHDWMLAQRDLVSNESATAKALDYSLKRWVALTNYLDDGALPIDQNKVENQIRPWADANDWRGDADKKNLLRSWQAQTCAAAATAK